MTRYASRPLRLWAAAQQAAAQQQKQQQQHKWSGSGGSGSSGSGGAAPAVGPAPGGLLRVADGGMELTIEPARAIAR